MLPSKPRMAMILGALVGAVATAFALLPGPLSQLPRAGEVLDDPKVATPQQDSGRQQDGSGELGSCRPPQDFRMPRVEQVPRDAVRRTPVTRYTLALSWSPGYCARSRGGAGDAIQCEGKAGRFGFVLHGLWPETNGRDWPQYCAPARAISRETLRQHLCMTPSPALLQHEWARHGTCMATSPEEYLDAAAQAYHRLAFPDMAALTINRSATAGDLRRAFVRNNPGLTRAMVGVKLRDGGWLDEVRLCLDWQLAYTPCRVGERGANDGARLRIEPIRQAL